jgi:hypothetical protein
MPLISEFNANGPSRHRLRKGLILVTRDRKREARREEQQWIRTQSMSILAAQGELSEFAVEADPSHPAVVSIVTPLATVHTVAHRNIFFQRLAQVLRIILELAEKKGLVPLGAGINPFLAPPDGYPPALCADVHEIEILDDLEVNRIYNLFRQYLPELIALSAHSALYGGQLQKDLSTRMRLNPESFTPPSLTLFSRKQLDRLKRAVRKDYGLSDLTQLDVNPISSGTIALRFVDAQASLPFMRTQLLLFQAISIHGRSLARQGSQMPILHSRIVGENKALAIESGPAAILKPDRKREVKRISAWYQDRKSTERASTALLEALQHRTVEDSANIVQALRTLRASYDELAPWLLGAELRKRGEACLVNYGEYQLRLFHVNPRGWQEQLQTDQYRLFNDPSSDLLSEYNESKFSQLDVQIGEQWKRVLDPREDSFDRRPDHRRGRRENHR